MNDICHDSAMNPETSFSKNWKKGLFDLIETELVYELLIHHILSCCGEQGSPFISISSAFVMANLLKGKHFDKR